MTFNCGNGLFDKYGLIESIIENLNKVQVCGFSNMGILIDSAQKLNALKQGLKKEDDAKEGTADENN